MEGKHFHCGWEWGINLSISLWKRVGFYVVFVWSFNWIGERSSCWDVALSIFPAMWQGKDEGGERQMDWTCLPGHIFAVKHNVFERELSNSWQTLECHFCCFYLSLILCPLDPLCRKKKELEELLNYSFPVLDPVNVEIFNFHNQAA